MNLQTLQTKLEPGRPVWVLIHKDGHHLFAKETYEPFWSYDKKVIKLQHRILVKDFRNKSYTPMLLHEAVVIVANKQAELVEAWTPAINQIRDKPHLEDRMEIYQHTYKKIGPHPVEADALLKKLLKLN